MSSPAPIRWPTGRISASRYLRLVERGVLGPDERVELLEGVVVAMAPSGPRHAAAVRRMILAFVRAVGDRAVVSAQLTFVAGRWSVPEPDLALLPGTLEDYDAVHPSDALLVVEASDSSLPQDRITKTAIYAGAGIPEYWIVNLRQDVVEVHRRVDRRARRYRVRKTVPRGETLTLVAFPDVRIAVDAIMPKR
jgi:Uma2 family endonuclease